MFVRIKVVSEKALNECNEIEPGEEDRYAVRRRARMHRNREKGLTELEPAVGFEPTTDGLQNRCSTTELSWPPNRTIFLRHSSSFGKFVATVPGYLVNFDRDAFAQFPLSGNGQTASRPLHMSSSFTGDGGFGSPWLSAPSSPTDHSAKLPSELGL